MKKTPCQKLAFHLTRTSKEQPRTTHLLTTTSGAVCGSLIRHERSNGECAQRLTTARTHNAFTTTPRNLHTRQHVVRATNHQEPRAPLSHSPCQHSNCNDRTKNNTKVRFVDALSHMRHTSQIPSHTQRTHLWAARHGCTRTCALHRQSKHAIHTERKTKTCSTYSMYRDVRNPTSQHSYSAAAAWDSEEVRSLMLTV